MDDIADEDVGTVCNDLMASMECEHRAAGAVAVDGSHDEPSMWPIMSRTPSPRLMPSPTPSARQQRAVTMPLMPQLQLQLSPSCAARNDTTGGGKSPDMSFDLAFECWDSPASTSAMREAEGALLDTSSTSAGSGSGSCDGGRRDCSSSSSSSLKHGASSTHQPEATARGWRDGWMWVQSFAHSKEPSPRRVWGELRGVHLRFYDDDCSVLRVGVGTVTLTTPEFGGVVSRPPRLAKPVPLHEHRGMSWDILGASGQLTWRIECEDQRNSAGARVPARSLTPQRSRMPDSALLMCQHTKGEQLPDTSAPAAAPHSAAHVVHRLSRAPSGLQAAVNRWRPSASPPLLVLPPTGAALVCCS